MSLGKVFAELMDPGGGTQRMKDLHLRMISDAPELRPEPNEVKVELGIISEEIHLLIFEDTEYSF